MIRNGPFSLAVQVPNVERQPELWMIDALMQFCKLRHGVDEHAWLGLERQTHV